MTGYLADPPRILRSDDASPARVLVRSALGGTPYEDRVLEILALAERGHDPEHRALLLGRDGTVAALALYGEVAGSLGAGRLHTLLRAPSLRDDDAVSRLIDAVAAELRATGARFLIAEQPDDPVLGAMLGLLRRHGFTEQARVADFYRDGVDLVFLRMAL